MVHDASQPLEITIDGRTYDATSVLGRHPGGSIIKYYNGKDATLAFNEFHGRSPGAYKWLKSLKSRDASQPLSKLEEDYRAFRQELVDEGWFEPNLFHVAYRVTEVFALHALGLYLMFAGYFVPAAIVLGIAQGRAGWAMHEGGHYSFTGSPRVDIAIQVLLYSFLDGMSASWWRNQHNRHHAFPQHIKQDVDLQTLPFVAFHSKIADKAKSPLGRVWLKFQAFLFLPVVTLLVTFGWKFFLHPRHCIRKGKWVELAAMVLRLVAIATLIVPKLGLGYTLSMYVAASLAGGCYIFGNFALSHTHKPIVDEGEDKDWVRYAAEHTTDITPNVFTDWWMGYLNYQIEHHLFPTMPQYRFVALAPRVRAFFESHGIEYDVRGYFAAVKDTLVNLNDIGAALDINPKTD